MTIKKITENPTLTLKVDAENKLKEYLVDYVGEKEEPENGEVTVEMVIGTLTDEFPDLVLALAEENFIRGYQQAFNDIEATTAAYAEIEQTDE